MVPGLAIAEQLYESNAPLDKAARDEATSSVVTCHLLVDPIHFLRRRGFL